MWCVESGQDNACAVSQLVRLRLQTIFDDFRVEAAALTRFAPGSEEPTILGSVGQADDITVAELARVGGRNVHTSHTAGSHAWGMTFVEGRALYSTLAEPAMGGLLIALAVMPDDVTPLAAPQTLILLLSYLVNEVASTAPLDVSLMDGMPWAAALLDASALVLFMNERAKYAVSHHPQIEFRQGRLRLRRGAVDRTLRRLVEQVARGERPRAVVPVPDCTGAIEMALHLEALPRSARIVAGQVQHRAIAYMIELRAFNAPDRRALASLFSLSAKEARLAELLCRGLRLEAASQVMGISRNTAKIHLRHILEKTGTSGQVDLARLLSHLPEGVGHAEVRVGPLDTRPEVSRTP